MPTPLRYTLACLLPVALAAVGAGIAHLILHGAQPGRGPAENQKTAAAPTLPPAPRTVDPPAEGVAIVERPAAVEPPVVPAGAPIDEPVTPVVSVNPEQSGVIRRADYNDGAESEGAPPRPAAQPSVARYRIASGLYRQRGTQGAEPRYLSVQGDGRGQLVLHFNRVSAFFVGARKVVIDTTWEVDEPNDEVTFTLTGGVPEKAYRAVLNMALDRVTRFHIDDFQDDSIVLRRVGDGEVFHWELLPE